MLIPGLSNRDAENVFLGNTAAQAVYLGTQQVWPTVTLEATGEEVTPTQEETP